MSGYSQTPLAKKLGIKAGFIVKLIHTPSHYFELFTDWPANISLARQQQQNIDLIHLFVTQARQLQKELPGLKAQLRSNGCIWVSWYKKAAKIPTDIDEDLIRQVAFANGLVDIKVCAVDEQWSGLKLVIPVKNRT